MTRQQAAEEYIRRGWSPVPLPPRSKAPVRNDWQLGGFTISDFADDGNIGVILGELSRNLVDIDLDLPEAVELAGDLLPWTAATFGRGGVRTHLDYYTDAPQGTRRWRTSDGRTIIELRGNGSQTMMPGSVHPNGEPVEWISDGEPAFVPWQDLVNACEEVAQAVRANLGETRMSPPPSKPPAAARPTNGDHTALLIRAHAYAEKATAYSEGGRNQQAFSIAGHLAAMTDNGHQLTADEIVDVLERRWNQRNAPPLPTRELVTTVRSAIQNGTPRPLKPGERSAAALPAAIPPAQPELLPEFKTATTLIREAPSLRRPVVHGLLREGETMNFIAPSKTGKSWLALSLAASVASGRAWLNHFQVEPGSVLIIDNELHRETIAHRVPKVIEELNLPHETSDAIYIESLRGRLQNIYAMGPYFRAIQSGQFKLIIIDAFYRMIPERTQENDNGAMALMFNAIDAHADRLKCAFACIHHSSKGSQHEKSVVDVGSGAGSMARAADAHCVLRAHEEQGAYVLEAVARSWPPPPAIVLRWDWPVFIPADDLNPADLKRPPRGNGRGRGVLPAPKPEPWTVERFVDAFVPEDPTPRSVIQEAAIEGGVPARRAGELLRAAIAKGSVFAHRPVGRNPGLVSLRPPTDEKRGAV